MTNDTERLFELCERVSSGTADPSQVIELQSLMEQSETVRRTFLDWSEMQVDIMGAITDSHARLVLSEEFNRQPASSQLSRWHAWLAALAASMVVVGLFALSWQRSAERSSNEISSKIALETESQIPLDGMAVLNRLDHVRWVPSRQKYAVGDLLKSDTWIEIESGVAEIEFGQGAVVVLEGPARFVAKSTSVGQLEYGKLAAVVPPWADGFRVDTRTLEVVDRGTQFVVEVTADQQVNVGVTKGEVELSQQPARHGVSAEKATHRLFAGKAVQTVGNQISEMTFDEQWHTLSQQLPIRPDHADVEVVAKYRRDFVVGTANEPRREGNWRYYANVWAPANSQEGYSELLWDSRRAVYDPNGDRGWKAGSRLNAANFSYRGGHPGQGRDQTKDDIDHYVISAYQVPAAGRYRIESGWLVRAESREDLQNQSVDLRVWVNQGTDLIAEPCSRNGLLRFQGDLGILKGGDWVYVGVGPQGVAHNDRFEWDFAIVRRIEGVAL